MNKLIFRSMLLIFLANSFTEAMETVRPFATNAMLIFLDDSEKSIGAISNDFLRAIIEEAGPIIASASLLVNIREAEKPLEQNPHTLLFTLQHIDSRSALQKQQEKEIILSVVNLKDRALNWLIKEINSHLYLLIPKKYLESKEISIEEAENLIESEALTATEFRLGLKINHMKTVNVAHIKEPSWKKFADYFMQSLSNIFITNKEYFDNKKSFIPSWAFYIAGHGLIGSSLAYLSLQQFKEFLSFIDNKLQTKLLFYSSCYAAGVNAEIIYKDAQKNMNQLYTFVIITNALTDAPTTDYMLTFEVKDEKLTLMHFDKFKNFINTVTISDVLDYYKLISSFVNYESFTESNLHNLPQIKFPGLPWFSALDNGKVVSIGEIMAKSRTLPLNLATFFARKKSAKPPLGILLYSRNVPFEIVLEKNAIPAIISMIPGNALHRIAKISAEKLDKNIYNLDKVFEQFLRIRKLASQKIFLIEEMTGIFSETMRQLLNAKEGKLRNVIIHLKDLSNRFYFAYENKIYQGITSYLGGIKFKPAKKDEINQYNNLLQKYSVFSGGEINLSQATKWLTESTTTAEIEKNIIKLLDSMPDNSIIRMSKIIKDKKSYDNLSLLDAFKSLADDYIPVDEQKIIWIDAIEIPRSYFYIYDVIIDTSRKRKVRIYFKDKAGDATLIEGDESMNFVGDYTASYKDLLDYYEKHKTLDKSLEEKIAGIEKSSLFTLLSPENIAQMEKTLIARRAAIGRSKSAHSLFELTSNLSALAAVAR